MVRILQIETSGIKCSAAISEDGICISKRERKEENIHGAALQPMIDDLLEERGIKYKDLDAVAVSKGPGSYTGLRIGTASAKGICYSSEKPLIAIPTLQIMAKRALIEGHTSKRIIPMIDARRMEVYMAEFNDKLEYNVVERTAILDEEFFKDLAKNGDAVLLGAGAEKADNMIVAVDGLELVIGIQASAEDMSELAFDAFNKKQFEDVAYFEPFYLKDFIATVPKKNILGLSK